MQIFKETFSRGDPESRAEELRIHYGVKGITVADIYDLATIKGIDYYGLVSKGGVAEEDKRIATNSTPIFQIDPSMTNRRGRDYRDSISKSLRICEDLEYLKGKVVTRLKTDPDFYVDNKTDVYSALLNHGRDTLAFIAMMAGAGYLIYKIYNGTIKPLSQNGANNEDEKEFNVINLKPSLTRIAGISVIDVMEAGKKGISPDRFLTYLTECQLIANGKHPKKHIEDNLARPHWKNYPNMTAESVLLAAAQTNVLYLTTPEMIDSFSLGSGGSISEIKQNAKSILERFANNLEAMQKTLLDPNSPQFPALKDAITAYISQNGIAGKIALHIAFNGSEIFIKQLYRVAQEQIESGKEKAFYSQIMEPLVQFIDEAPTADGLITADDISLFFDEIKEKGAPTPRELELKTLAISNLTRNRTFLIDPDFLDLKGMVKPRKIHLDIDSYNPRKSTVSFEYDNGTDEPATLILSIDLKQYKEGVEWSFVEAPSDMPDIRDALLRTAGVIISAVEEQTKLTKQKKNDGNKDTSLINQPKPSQKTEKVRPEPEKQISARKRRSNGIIEAMIANYESPEPTPKQKIRNIIVVADQELLDKQLEKFSSVDRTNVMAGINDFNARGVGKFSRLVPVLRGPNGEYLYTLRTKATVGGGIRVLLVESRSGNSMREFKVIDVGYRKDIYRRNIYRGGSTKNGNSHN